MSNKKIFYPLLVLVIGFALAYILANSEPELTAAPLAKRVTSVRVIPAESTSEFLSIASQGTVQPRMQSELIPEVSGRVVWTSPALVGGGSFTEGDILLRIDDADYQSSLRRGAAVLERAEVEHSYANDELSRLQRLFEQQLASQSQLDSGQRAARIAQANLSEAQANLDQAQRDLGRTQLQAPFDGLVRSEQVDIGQFVSRGTSIGTIYATDYVEVRLPIAADQLRYLGLPISSRGQIPAEIQPEVMVTAAFGTTTLVWEGLLVRTEAEIDERSRMLYGVARLRLSEDLERASIPVGRFVQAEIRGRKVDGIVRLPRSSIRDNDQVLVVDEDKRLQFRSVSILRLEHDDVLISAGLNDGDLVCTSPLQTVVEGMRVEPVFE